MNKQPFYHRAVILFTATREMYHDDVKEILEEKFKSREFGIISHSIECEEVSAEPGDPADLM